MRRRYGWAAWVLVGLVAAGGAFLLAREQATGGGKAVEPPARGLPHTPDYHSLLVDAEDPVRLLLGTHVGLYESKDGGQSWRFASLEGKDVMHLARARDGTVWAAGHNVLERSSDGGRTWSEARPDGLPGLDVHGFALDAEDSSLVYAAIAGEGLYRSQDGGATFTLTSEEVGPNVYALAVTRNGTLLAADRHRGVLENASGDGADWRTVLEMRAVGLAANRGASRVLAAGESVQLYERDGWKEVLAPAGGAGPVAFAPGDPSLAYAVGFDRKLYRSTDGGETWAAVA